MSAITNTPQVRTLLLTDLVDSTSLVERLGDSMAAELFRAHDRIVLDLQQRWRGRLIDRSDGLLLIFERPIDGLGFALDYVRGLRDLGREHKQTLQARAGLHVGEVLVSSQAKIGNDAQHSGVSVQSTLILGGQIAGERPGLYMIYPLGNCIAASPETPYLQIGESKYGKPILDRILRPETSLENAARCALVSLDSTIRSNLSVGMPIDLALLRAGDLKLTQQMRLEGDTPLYAEIHDSWSQKLEAAVHSLPRFPWEPARSDEPAGVAPTPQAPPRRAPARRDPGDAQGQQ